MMRRFSLQLIKFLEINGQSFANTYREEMIIILKIIFIYYLEKLSTASYYSKKPKNLII